MKKLCFTMVLFSVAMVFADMKIGTVNMLELVKFHPERAKDMQVLKESEKSYKKTLEAARGRLEEIAKEGRELQQKLQNPLIQEKAKEEAASKLEGLRARAMEAQQAYQAEAMRAQSEMQRLDETLLRATTESIRKRINEYAEEKGLELVLDVNVTPYAKKSLDVTDEILKKLGVDPAKARAEEKAKEEAGAVKSLSESAPLPITEPAK